MRREQIWGDGGDDTNRNGAAHGIFLLGEIAARGFEFAEDGAGAGKKRLADFGEADGTAEAIEEASAEFVLEFADLLGERGLRDVGLTGRAAEAAGVDDGAEVAELVEFHELMVLDFWFYAKGKNALCRKMVHRLCLSILCEVYIGRIAQLVLSWVVRRNLFSPDRRGSAGSLLCLPAVGRLEMRKFLH